MFSAQLLYPLHFLAVLTPIELLPFTPHEELCYQKAPGDNPRLRSSQKRQRWTLLSYGMEVINATVLISF